MRHSCFRQPDSILEKLRRFHQGHETPVDRLLADLNAAVGQLPSNTRSYEAKIVASVLQERAQRRRGGSAISDVLNTKNRVAVGVPDRSYLCLEYWAIVYRFLIAGSQALILGNLEPALGCD